MEELICRIFQIQCINYEYRMRDVKNIHGMVRSMSRF